MPDDKPRDWRWRDKPAMQADTGIVPLAPSSAVHDPPALLTEADRFGQDWPNRTLRVGLVADLAAVARAALAERDEARRERDRAIVERDVIGREYDRFARRIRGAKAVLDGAAVAENEADQGPCGWTSR